ncbi:MAG: GTPase HflX [Planctomycetes bacterium]|nr:GTPase HflX [Planctomycetota bacterium]
MTEAPDPERRPIAVLAAALPRQDQRLDLERPLGELAALADTAGVEVRGESIIQRRDRPDGATSLGKGTVLRLQEALEATGAELVIFDNDLKPRQRRNLEKQLGKRIQVIDRTELILNIFASHARTPQARLQVEVAKLEYELPRLRRLWTHLDTGVGLRAAGEKQLEVDKRLVRKRIQDLKRELVDLRARKEREVDRRSEAYCVSLVGYTNAGKSTLMNRLTDADVYVADKLFATLDTRTRTWAVGPNREVLLSDTVGFIRHLPHNLVESFHATLEEAVTADLLLHVVDASDPEALEHVRAVREVLASLGIKDRDELIVLNKVDRAEPELLPYLERRLVNTIRVSAKTGEGAEALAAKVNELAAATELDYEVSLDVREGAAIAYLEGLAEVRAKELREETLDYTIRCRPAVLGGLRRRVRKPQGLVIKGEPEPQPDDLDFLRD